MLLMSPTPNKKERQERFHRAAIDAYERHGFKSLRDAENKTSVNYSTIHDIVNRGKIPGTRGMVIEWAQGLGEDINYWLELAGYESIPPELVCLPSEAEEVRERGRPYSAAQIDITFRKTHKIGDETWLRIREIIDEAEEEQRRKSDK